MNINTKAQRLEAGDPVTEEMLEILHWAERVQRSGISYGLDFENLMARVREWVDADRLYPGDIVLHEDRPGVPNTLLKINDYGDIELITPEGQVLLGSARHLTPTGLRAPHINAGTSYIYNGRTGQITARATDFPDVEDAHAARFTNGHLQILVGGYWVAPFYEVDQ